MLTEFPEKTVIIGAGPTGLLQALYMCKLGHDVVVLEKRDDYKSRENALLQQYEAIELLLKDFTNFYQCGLQFNYRYTGSSINIDVSYDPMKVTDPNAKLEDIDVEFIESLRRAHDDVATNQFQEYIMQKQATLTNKHNLKIVTNAEAINLNTTAKSINYLDAKKGEVVEIGYNNLIICEGAQRKLTQQIIAPDQIKVMQNPDDVVCAHGVGFINVPHESLELYKRLQEQKPLAGVIVPKTVENIKTKKSEFKALGWKYSSAPKFYIVAEKEPARFYLVGEIPIEWQQQLDAIKKSGDQDAFAKAKIDLDDKMQQWFRIAIAAEYPGINTKQLFMDRAGVTQAQSFIAKPPTVLKSAFTSTQNGSRIFFVGDTLFTPHYKLGMGLLFGALSAKAVAECFDSDGRFQSSTPMIKLVNKLQKEYARILQIYNLAVLGTKNFPLTYRYVIDPLRNASTGLLWLQRKITKPRVKDVGSLEKMKNRTPTKPKRP